MNRGGRRVEGLEGRWQKGQEGRWPGRKTESRARKKDRLEDGQKGQEGTPTERKWDRRARREEGQKEQERRRAEGIGGKTDIRAKRLDGQLEGRLRVGKMAFKGERRKGQQGRRAGRKMPRIPGGYTD